MKKAIIIFLVLSLVGAFWLKANAQPTPVKIADETTISYVNDTAIIQCDNETIFYKLLHTHGQLISLVEAKWRSNKEGRYLHYVLYLNKKDANIVVNWAKSNL